MVNSFSYFGAACSARFSLTSRRQHCFSLTSRRQHCFSLISRRQHRLSLTSHHQHHLLLPNRSQNLFRLRSEEHTSELQSRGHLVCRLLLETKDFVVHHSHHFY